MDGSMSVMKPRLICTALLIAAFSLPMFASPITYNITFTTTTGLAPTSGSFTFDPVTGFTNFLVLWDGITFNETASANAPNVGLTTGCMGEASTPAYGFMLMQKALVGCNGVPVYTWSKFTNFNTEFQFKAAIATPFGQDTISAGNDMSVSATGGGSWSVTPVTAPVPEPSTIGLTLLGLGLLGLMRERIVPAFR
jgi:PEP-CTERM motif